MLDPEAGGRKPMDLVKDDQAELETEGEAEESDGAAFDPASEAELVHPDARWYVIHTYSGYENKVKANLEKRVESMQMGGQIFKVFVPVEEQIEVKDGKRRIVQRKIFPGYVLVQMIMTDDSWYVVRNTPGVTGFVGAGGKPTSLD